MAIYKVNRENDEILEMKISLLEDDGIFTEESLRVKDIKGKRKISIHVLPGVEDKGVGHGPRYKIIAREGNGKPESLTYPTLRPNGKIIFDKQQWGSKPRLGEEYSGLIKAVVMETYPEVLKFFESGQKNKDLLKKAEDRFNELSTAEKKNLIRKYNSKF